MYAYWAIKTTGAGNASCEQKNASITLKAAYRVHFDLSYNFAGETVFRRRAERGSEKQGTFKFILLRGSWLIDFPNLIMQGFTTN